jgi:hypothetical protein
MKKPSTAALIFSVLAASAALALPSAQADIHADRSLLSTHPSNNPANAAQTPGAVALPAGAILGSYTVEVVSPIIYRKNVMYQTPFPLPQRLPGRATVVNVE